MRVKQFMNLRGKLVPRRFFIFLRVDEEGADNWSLYIQVKSALPSSDAVTHIRDMWGMWGNQFSNWQNLFKKVLKKINIDIIN